MRNKIDMALPPQDAFVNPWNDDGFALLAEPAFIWRHVNGGTIRGFAASAHEEISAKIEAAVRRTLRTKVLSAPIEYETLPVQLTDPNFRRAGVVMKDRMLLNGASGFRSINTYRRENSEHIAKTDAAMESYFTACRSENLTRRLPVFPDALDPHCVFVIECRNTFNYFHFITESLCQLVLLDDIEFSGDIVFTFPNKEEKHRPFIESFVTALFPELAGRVHYNRKPLEFERAITAYDLLSLFPFAPDFMFQELPDADDVHIFNRDTNSIGALWRIIAANGYSSALRGLRQRALNAIEGQDFSHLPTRFFVGRDDRASRARAMAGQEQLFRHLEMFDFGFIVFEGLTPLEQIAIMARAEMMVSCHGAGFTNMLFANPEAYVIEVGTLQTAQHRWTDFWPLAHLAQCTYVNFFADFNADDPLREPNFATDGIVPVAASEQAVAQIMSFVVSVLGQLPTMRSHRLLSELGRSLFAVGLVERTLELLALHKGLVADHSDLSILKADCHKHLDEPKSELVALDAAYKADRSNWQVLIRIIWCANRCERPQVIRWALSLLKNDFPDRHEAFVGNHEWIRHVA